MRSMGFAEYLFFFIQACNLREAVELNLNVLVLKKCLCLCFNGMMKDMEEKKKKRINPSNFPVIGGRTV